MKSEIWKKGNWCMTFWQLLIPHKFGLSHLTMLLEM